MGVELLSPAGSYPALIAALAAGADAVYAGGAMFGARAYAANFTSEEMLQAIDLCHLHGKKLYMTVNTLCKEREFDQIYGFLRPFYEQGLDGVIVQDIGIVSYIREFFPDLHVHASTQMTITGINGVRYAKSLGMTRVVPARELSLKEIKNIRNQTDMELECFIHGAMCYSYSGQCLFSSFLGGRSGNRGRCAQPCRLPYSLLEDGRVVNPENESYIISMKDLCTIELLPELIDAGITSFKIEGRMKSPEYVYFITSVYRKYIDRYYDEKPDKYRVDEDDLKKIRHNFIRSEMQRGYYEIRNGRELITIKKPSYSSENDIGVEDYEKKLSTLTVDGLARFAPGEKAMLNLSYNNTNVSVYGAVCEPAIKKPLDIESINRQLRKTGDTGFEFGTLDIEIAGDIFLPVRELNELRRRAFDEIRGVILEGFRRRPEPSSGRWRGHLPPLAGEGSTSGATLPSSGASRHLVSASLRSAQIRRPPDVVRPPEGEGYSVGCGDIGQLRAALKYRGRFDTVYVEAGAVLEAGEEQRKIWQELGEACRMYLALPYILRDDRAGVIDRVLASGLEYEGFLVRNYEELEIVKELGRPYVTDFGLYCFNRRAALHFLENGAERITLPLELNVHEMKELDCLERSELLFYGRAPMMISASCVQKTTGGCKKGRAGDLALLDRYKKKFPVKTDCENCYNIIYNSAPTYLIKEMEAIEKLSPACLRIQFTTETESECRRVLSEIFDNEPVEIEYTKGHFRKSVL